MKGRERIVSFVIEQNWPAIACRVTCSVSRVEINNEKSQHSSGVRMKIFLAVGPGSNPSYQVFSFFFLVIFFVWTIQGFMLPPVFQPYNVSHYVLNDLIEKIFWTFEVFYWHDFANGNIPTHWIRLLVDPVKRVPIMGNLVAPGLG